MTASDEPNRSSFTVVAVAATLAVIGILVAAYFLFLRSSASSPYTVAMSATQPADGNRVVPATTPCPDGGRADGPLTGDFEANTSATSRTTYGPGQIAIFQFLVEAGDDAAPETTPEFVAGWDRSRSGDSGFDANIGIFCAFVDASDPARIETSDDGDPTPMTVTWKELPPDNSDIRGKFAIAGMQAGDSAVVEVWMVLTDNGSTDPISAQLRLEGSDEAFRAVPVQDAIDLRIEFFDLLEPVQVEMTMTDPETDDGSGLDRRQRVTYNLTVTNQSATNVANDVVLSDSFDPFTSVVSVEVTDDEGARTECPIDDDQLGFQCNLRFLNPSEVVSITAQVDVLADAEVRWVKEDGDCEDGLQDICNRAVLQWAKSPTIRGEQRLDEPSNIPNSSILSVAKLSAFVVAYPNERVPFEYAVTTASTSQLSNVTVTDSGCNPIEFNRGDEDGDVRLDPDEQWFFACTVKAISPEDQTTEVTVSALDDSGTPISRTEIVELRLISPAIAITALPSSNAERDKASFQVQLSGDDPLREIVVEASNCSPPELESGDTNSDDILNAGESWILTCTKGNPDAPIDATVYGTDSRGAAVTNKPPPAS